MAESKANDDSVWRSLISLALVIHLFCIGVVLASNFRRSPLQSRLVSIFAAYTRAFDFDPDFTPYYDTLGRVGDDDTWLAIDLYKSGELPVDRQEVAGQMQLPEAGGRWLGDRRRGFRLAKLLAERAEAESDADQDVASEIARAVGHYAMRQTGNGRAVIRAVRRMSQPYDLATLNPGFPPDKPTAPAYDMTVYEADAWIDEDGQVQVLRRASRAEVAPRSGGAPAQPAP